MAFLVNLNFTKLLTDETICDEILLLKPLKIGQNIREIQIVVSELVVGSGECEKIKEIFRETFA